MAGELYLDITVDTGEPVPPEPLPVSGARVPRLLLARRAFPAAQRLLIGSPGRSLGTVEVGWHDTTASREAGATAVVRSDGPLLDLIGETLRLEVDGRAVLVYVVGRAAVPSDLSLARRAFFQLALLSAETLDCAVAVEIP